MTSYKETQRELRRPDELQKIGQQALPWVEKHGKLAVTLVLSVVGAGGLIALGFHIFAKGEEKATHDFGAALQVLSRDVKPEAKAAEPKVDAPATPDEDPPFKTEADKEKALLDALATFHDSHKGSKAAVNAALPLAQAWLRQGDPGKALTFLDEYLKGADPADPLRAGALEARGYAFEAQQKYDDALAAFDQLARENKTDYLKGMGQFHRARILALKGDKEGAAKQYVELETLSPNTAAARMAKERIALLVAQGVAVPKPPPPVPVTFDAGK